MSARTRASRATTYRQRYRSPRFGMHRGYYGAPWGSWGWGYRSVGIWDLFFLSTVSHMFWYHHWHEPGIQRALYKDNMLQKEELTRLEARVKGLEAKGVQRDPNYLPADVDADIAHSKAYVEQNKARFETEGASEVETEAEANAQPGQERVGWLWVLFGLGGIASLFHTLFMRRY